QDDASLREWCAHVSNLLARLEAVGGIGLLACRASSSIAGASADGVDADRRPGHHGAAKADHCVETFPESDLRRVVSNAGGQSARDRRQSPRVGIGWRILFGVHP